jgi:glyoxylase-like metal-dependent hydrolase (beta-lactamase superfamily II)
MGLLKKLGIGLVLVVGAGAAGLGAVMWSTFHGIAPMPPRTDLPDGAMLIQDGFVGVGVVPVGDGKAVLIDCGNDAAATTVKAALEQAHLTPVAALITHGHPDHVGGCNAFAGLELVGMPGDVALAAGQVASSSPIGSVMGKSGNVVHVTRQVKDGELLEYGAARFRVFAVPGHTQGSAAYLVNGILFLGDSAAQRDDGTIIRAPWVFSDDLDRNVDALHQLATRIAPSEVRVMVFAHSAVSDKGPAALAAVTR